jgi:hypothetical protein
MSYVFRGNLCGWFCAECSEELSDVTVRLYRNRSDQNVTALAVASPNDTLALLTDDDVKAKASQLIAETKTDANGNFSFTLGREQKYEGGAFEVDVYCGTVPHRKQGRKQSPPRQFSITTLQPAWKQTGDNDFLSVWNHCIPYRFWCHLRWLFDAWVICGRLTSCQDGSPIPGATVSAFDRDWIQDDPLGSAATDSNGRFRIDYNREDFTVTPFSPLINIEFGGPDVYFKATLGTDVILNEPPATGRDPGRENIGPCFCVDLCSDQVQGGCGVSCQPHWQKVWDFDIHPDAGQLGSQFSAEGYAGGAAVSYVFGDMNYRSGVLLRGNCPLVNPAAPANALQYRFVIGEYTWPGTPDDPNVIPSVPPVAPLPPVTKIASTTVGYVFYTDGHGVPSSADVNITSADLDPSGWVSPILGRIVSVDMHDGTFANVTVTDATFLRTDELIVLNSSVITSAHAPKLPGGLPQTQAGRALLDSEKEPIRRYTLQFEVRDATTLVTIFTDTLSSIILNNSSPILALDMEELFLNLCNPLGGANTAHVLYTADHPHLNSFALTISSNLGLVHPSSPAPGPPTVNGFLQLPQGNFPPGGFFFRGGNSGPHNGTFTGGFPVDISADPSCAYRVNLTWNTRHYPQALGDDKPEILYCR